MKSPELLAPAGTLRNLRYAIAYGADAVYAGMPRYSLRVRNNDFSTIENLAAGIEQVHAKSKAFFMATNLLPHNSKVKTFMADMEPIIELGPDALIMADPGLIMMVRERWPEIAIHLSVQANTMNYASVRFWQQLGIKRIILSRELSLDQVEEIRQQCPDMELEVLYTVRCVSPIPGVACYPATSIIVMPTRAVAPTPVAGTTRSRMERRTTVGIFSPLK